MCPAAQVRACAHEASARRNRALMSRKCAPCVGPWFATSSDREPRRHVMLPIAIVMFCLAGIIIGFNAAGVIGAGSLAFSMGFLILAAIAGLSFWRSRAS